MLKTIMVPAMLVLSSTLMAFAWIGHLKYAKSWTFLMALGISWMIVLPEYLLNVGATRWGRDVYTGAQMATFNLCSGVVCVALVSHFFLKEKMGTHQIVGFVLMAIAMVLITYRGDSAA